MAKDKQKGEPPKAEEPKPENTVELSSQDSEPSKSEEPKPENTLELSSLEKVNGEPNSNNSDTVSAGGIQISGLSQKSVAQQQREIVHHRFVEELSHHYCDSGKHRVTVVLKDGVHLKEFDGRSRLAFEEETFEQAVNSAYQDFVVWR